jgi:hypothetical protein
MQTSAAAITNIAHVFEGSVWERLLDCAP